MDAAEDLSRFTNHFQQLCAIVTKLRAPGGCPWDREQTHESLLPALIEEAYEVAGGGRPKKKTKFFEETGGLFFLIFFYAAKAPGARRINIENELRAAAREIIPRAPPVVCENEER